MENKTIQKVTFLGNGLGYDIARVVIPKPIVEKLKIKKGDHVWVECNDKSVIFTKVKGDLK